MLFCGCFMTSIAFWPAMATQGDSSLHSIFTRDGLVKEGKQEDKARNFLLLVLCGSKSREATSNRDRERGPRFSPGAHRQRSQVYRHTVGNFIWHVWCSAGVF